MFGYACDETESLMPYAIDVAHKLAHRLAEVRKEGIIPYLKSDGKVQVTAEYLNNYPFRIDTILISTRYGVPGYGKRCAEEHLRQGESTWQSVI